MLSFKLTTKKNVSLYGTIAIQFVLLFFLSFLFRSLFFWFNRSLFSEIDTFEFLSYCYYGLKFDIAGLLYVNGLYLVLSILPFRFRVDPLYRKILNGWFLFSNGLAFVLSTIDLAYFPFTLARSTSSIFNFIASENDLISLLAGFCVEYWFAPLSFLGIMALFIYLNSRIRVVSDIFRLHSLRFYSSSVVVLAVVVVVSIAAIRGGWSSNTRPMSSSFALKYVDDPIKATIILNTPFSVFRTLDKQDLKRIDYYSQEEVNQRFSVLHNPIDSAEFKPVNVVIIILESFGKEYIGFLNRDRESYEGFTPFLDSLMTVGKTFTNGYANGKKSIDAIPSIFAGIPSLSTHYIESHHSTNNINALPQMLGELGYTSAFYHGAHNGSMGFDAFCKYVGFDAYYGQNEYVETHEFKGNHWGVFDEEYFQYFAEGLDNMKPPFLGAFFSLSSHGPFVMPEKYEGKFTKGPLEVHEYIHYTDYSLQRFFEAVKDKPWYENTLFVITADHTSIPYFKEYNNGNGQFMIPIIFFQPALGLQGVDSTVTQQIDIMPTILGMINYPNPYIALGRDAMDTNSYHYAINYFAGNYQLTEGDYLFQFDLESERGKLFHLKNDPFLKKNLIHSQPKIADQMEQHIKVLIQQYHNRLLDNQFIKSS